MASPTFRPPFPHPSYTEYGQRLGIAWLFPPFVHPFPTLHTLSMGKGWALPGFPHLLSTLSPPFIHFAWAKAGHSRLSPYNYVNKKSHFIHSWIQCFLTKKNILIRGIKMTHLQFNLDIELLKANIMNSVPRKCSECMYRICSI